jgi:uncharacterized DUF497 family protein
MYFAEFEWDEEKSEKNFRERDFYFDDAIGIFEGLVVDKVDDRYDYGETRHIAIGMVDNRVLAVVYTWRGSVCRIISARKANRNERRAYSATLAGFGPDQEN